jgi:hypothetical protein
MCAQVVNTTSISSNVATSHSSPGLSECKGDSDKIVYKELLVHKQRSQAMKSYHSWLESFKQIAQAMKIENILCTSVIAKKSEE